MSWHLLLKDFLSLSLLVASEYYYFLIPFLYERAILCAKLVFTGSCVLLVYSDYVERLAFFSCRCCSWHTAVRVRSRGLGGGRGGCLAFRGARMIGNAIATSTTTCRCSHGSSVATVVERRMRGCRGGGLVMLLFDHFGFFGHGRGQTGNHNAPLFGQDQLNVGRIQYFAPSMRRDAHGLRHNLVQKVVHQLQDLFLGGSINAVRRIQAGDQIGNARSDQGS